MDQQQIECIVGDRIGALVDILGGEVGTLQRASDRKMAAELKRVQISFAAIWDELSALRDRIGNAQNEMPRLPTPQLGESANVTVLKYARAS